MERPCSIAYNEGAREFSMAESRKGHVMRVVSLNVGVPRTIHDRGREVTTGIFKEPVEEPVMLRRLNLDGDRQADLEVHGGRNKALYAYPSEHYQFWRKEFPEMTLPWGMFGENLTTEGLKEEDSCIGDQYRIGQAVVMVTQPRLPCYKLGIRFGRDDIVKRFLASGRSGIYFSVAEEGLVNAGDPIARIQRDESRVSVADINRAYVSGDDIPLLRRIVQLEMLPPGMRNYFVEQLSSFQD
jgi:MOSC domain-containing protein YiiM